MARIYVGRQAPMAMVVKVEGGGPSCSATGCSSRAVFICGAEAVGMVPTAPCGQLVCAFHASLATDGGHACHQGIRPE